MLWCILLFYFIIMKTEIRHIFNSSLDFQNLDKETQEELLQEFDLKIAEDWWEDWMNNYTEAKEDEEISEKENIEIEKEQARRFLNLKF